MSYLSKLIGKDRAKEAQTKANQAIEDAANQMGASSEKLKAIFDKLESESQAQSRNDFEARKLFEDKISTFISQLPLRNEQIRNNIAKNLGDAFNTSFTEKLSKENDIASQLRNFISQQNAATTSGLTSNLGNQENAVRNALNQYLSGETSRQAAMGIADAGARGFTPGGAVFNSFLADRLAGLQGLRFNTEQELAGNRANLLNQNLTNQSDIARQLESNLAERQYNLAGEKYQGQLGLAQNFSNLTREDQLAQQQAEFQNYLNQFNTRAQDYGLSKGIENTLKYQTPFDIQNQLNQNLLGINQLRIGQAQQNAANAQANYSGLVNAIGGTVGSLVGAPFINRGVNALLNKLLPPKLNPYQQAILNSLNSPTNSNQPNMYVPFLTPGYLGQG